jgi:CheY-like chemotaxis protein
LLADDSVTIQRVIELTFADEDIRVTAVGDGQQAIDRIAAEPPDIVLADVGMPGRDGYEVARFIKDDPRLSHIPVLLLTGAFEPVDEARARQVRCDGVLAKPFEPQLLIARVKELLRRPAAVAVPTAAGEPVEGNLPPADDDLVLDARQMLEGAPPRSLDAEGSLDDYFDRLDQAFANLAGTAAPHRDPLPRPAADLSWAPDEIRASSWPLADTVGPARERRAPAAPATASAAGLMSLPMADAFSALLQAESTEDPRAADRTSVFVQGRPEGSDAALDAIVERVIERLGLQQGQVAALVSEIAERLVREEIERLKAASGR